VGKSLIKREIKKEGNPPPPLPPSFFIVEWHRLLESRTKMAVEANRGSKLSLPKWQNLNLFLFKLSTLVME